MAGRVASDAGGSYLSEGMWGALCALAVLIAMLVLGLIVGQANRVPGKLVLLAALAIGLVGAGTGLQAYGGALGLGDPAMAGLLPALLGLALFFAGFFLGGIAGIGAVAHARREQQQAWLVIACAGSLVPLVAAVICFDYSVLGPFQYGENASIASVLNILMAVLPFVVPVIPLAYGARLLISPQ